MLGNQALFEPVLKDAKIASFSWHCLRHTFPSGLIMSGGHSHRARTSRSRHHCHDCAMLDLNPKQTLAALKRFFPLISTAKT
jgi:hypothetical protein